MYDCFGCMHPYPAGHWMYSLYDLLDNPLFLIAFTVFWVTTAHLLLRTVYRKFNISETVEIIIIFLLWMLMILSFYLCAILKTSL